MPLYEYRCHRCDQVFEVIQKFSDAPLTIHEDCGGELERLLSPPALQFKGSGWYVTDYGRNGGSTKSNGSEKPDKSDKSDKGESKGATGKPDTKSDTPSSAPKPAATQK